jgi:glutamate dehydrogenase (NADP+)
MTLITRRRIRGIFEGANIPITLDGQSYLREYKDSVLYIPGKAANAGGVGVSGFEISQNVQRLVWDSKTVDEKLKFLMKSIYNQLVDVSAGDSVGTLESGANQAGFLKVVKAMDDLGYL